MSGQIDINTIQGKVVLRHNHLCAEFPWEGGLEFAAAVLRLARFSREYAVHKQHDLVKTDRESVCHDELVIYRTGLEFIFVLKGYNWITCPWTAAVQIARTVKDQSAKLEEVANHERTIEDAALLLRTGLPIGITSNKKILKEAWKQAEDVSFPGMVEPTFVVYEPILIMTPPPVALEG